MVAHAAKPRVHVAAAQFLGADFLAGGRAHQRRPAKENRALLAHDDVLVAHRRHVGAARRARSHHRRHLRNSRGRHPRHVVEDAPEVLAVGKDLRLQRQERAARVDQVHARKMVLQRDFLRAQMLLDRHRIVGAALDGRVVGHHHDLAALQPPDAGDDPGAGRLVLVHPPRGERRQLHERALRIEQLPDAVAHQQLAALQMAAAGLLGAALAHALDRLAQLFDRRLHQREILPVLRARGVDAALDSFHRRPLSRFDPLAAAGLMPAGLGWARY